MTAPAPTPEKPTPFTTVLHDELDLLAAQRAQKSAAAPPDDSYLRAREMTLAGLAFSGGGIRSATFNLGFLQGLANRRVLHGFDYLSTVSGGGYIGGWLSALLWRRNGGQPVGEAQVLALAQSELATPPASGPRPTEDRLYPPESAAVRFVRRYADYLTPRLGLSGDTLALVSVMLRNVFVIQMLLLSLLVTVFSVMLLVAGADKNIDAAAAVGLPFLGVSLMLLALAAALHAQAVRRDDASPVTFGTATEKLRQQPPNLLISVSILLPALASGLALALAFKAAEAQSVPARMLWLIAAVCGYAMAWADSLATRGARLGMLAGAAILGLAIWFGVNPLIAAAHAAPFGHALAFAPLLALGLYATVITVHLALAGAAISEASREWWARIGGQALFLALAWTLAFGFLLYVPPLLSYSANLAAGGGALWAGASGLGARLAQGAGTGGTGGKGGSPWQEAVAKLAPAVFVIGMLGLVAWVFVGLLVQPHYGPDEGYAAMRQSYWRDLYWLEAAKPAICAVLAAVLFLLFLWRIDLNIFSAHGFYCNRLARSFLGASHGQRKPNPFTGFDPADDLPLHQLHGQRPIPLINANVNLTGGDELAWQTRRGASFAFTPAYCGFSAQPTREKLIGGYRNSQDYGGGLSLATAIAVSGAAASPNMGFHTSTAIAALLTIFNLRLARWCPHPKKEQWRRAAPAWGAKYLFAELLGEAGNKRAWINLSDGGHFDNLGLYELVRRRASLILVTDVGEDAAYHFDDLAMVKRKLWTDFAVSLHIDQAELAAIRPRLADAATPDEPRFSECHWAFGRIDYPDGQSARLIYVKSSLTREIPLDVRQYKDAHPAFPHEATADQWFDEDQFEAYRHLGQCIAEKLFAELLPEHDVHGATTLTAAELVAKLRQRACPESPPILTPEKETP